MAMQAIETEYHGPANVKGTRYSATCAGGRIIRDIDHALNDDENHIAVAKALAEKLNWSALWMGGVLASGNHVFVSYAQDDTPAFKSWK